MAKQVYFGAAGETINHTGNPSSWCWEGRCAAGRQIAEQHVETTGRAEGLEMLVSGAW